MVYAIERERVISVKAPVVGDALGGGEVKTLKAHGPQSLARGYDRVINR